MFLKNRNISSKIKRSKVTDYAALNVNMYAQSYGSMLDSRSRGCRFEPQRWHWVVSLSMVQSRKTHPDMTEKMLTRT